MDREYFVKKIIENVRDSAAYAMETNLSKPAGRNPDIKLIQFSKWYNGLENHDRLILKDVIKDSIDEAIFGFFCVLDGVRDISLEGALELKYKNERENQILNQGDVDLHDIYNDLTRK